MKKLLALCSIPASILAFTLACDDGGSTVGCETDADCAVGEACLPVSELDDTLICQTAECEAQSDCQIGFNNEGGSLVANQTCTAAGDCPSDETCVLGFNGDGFCVFNGACPAGFAGAATINVDLAGGGTGDVCVDEATQCVSGGCEP